jgi:hypothetical protein
MVEHENNPAPRTKNAVRFLDGFCGVRSMMEHAEGIHDIKGVLREREVLRIGDPEGTRNAGERKPALSQLNALRRQVDTGNACSASRKLKQICSKPAADLEEILAGEFPKSHKSLHERLETVSKLVNVLEELFLPPGFLRELCPTGMSVPILPDLYLKLFVHGLHSIQS